MLARSGLGAPDDALDSLPHDAPEDTRSGPRDDAHADENRPVPSYQDGEARTASPIPKENVMPDTETTTAPTPLASPLRPRPDQREQWIAHARPIPFEEAAHLVLDAHSEDGGRVDVAAHDLRAWAFGARDGAMAIAPVPLPGRLPMAPVPLRELAFTQLCTRVGAPPGYIRNLPAKLQVANMNWGITREQQPALLRLGGGEVRAIVSDRYAALDDDLVLEVVADVLDKAGLIDDALVRATAVGTSTILRVTIPSEGVAVKRDDVIEYGLDIGNSEVGLRSVQVTPITYRLVCTNGMRAWRSEAALRMRHIGDPKRLREQLREAVPVALAEARGDIERWRRATEVLIDSALDEIESLRALGLGQTEVQQVGRQLVGAAGMLPASTSVESLSELLKTPTTAFDIANAITATGRDREDVAARLTLEEAGHRYLSRRAV